MAPLESFNNLPETPVQKPTGVSETSKEYQNPSNNISEINQREKIDKSISEIGLSKEETEEIINIIISKFGNDTKTIDSILETISKDISIDSKDKVMGVIVEAEKTKVEAEKTKVEAEKTKVEAEKTKVEAEKTKVEAEIQSNVQEVYKAKEPLFKNLEQILSSAKLEGKNGKDIVEMLEKGEFDNVINTLKNKDSFYEVATELRKKDPEKYIQFKETLISIDPSFRPFFDEIGYEKKGTQKILDLGTPKISPDGKSGETVDGKHSIKIDDKGDRYLSSKDSPYQLKSNLDNKQNIEANQKIDVDLENTLKPINEKLNSLSSILDYLENAISKNIDLKDIKETIKKTDINLYNEYNIENLNSPNDIKNIISQSIKKLEDDKKTAIEKSKNLKRELILKNTKEAAEKDEAVKQLLKFLESIGFTFINQAKLQTILDFININPQTYGLDEKIDLENGVLGFNRDFGDKNINASEKKAFIKLFNRMLGENIIDENISTGITTLSPQAILRIQVLSNKTTGFFMENLGKSEETK